MMPTATDSVLAAAATPPSRRRRAPCWTPAGLAALVLLLVAGCVGDPAGEGGLTPTVAGGKADNPEVFRLEVTLGEDDQVTLREAGEAVLPGAPDPLTDFTCLPRFTRDPIERVECTRDRASFELLYDTAQQTAAMIFRPYGRRYNTRKYATCTTTSTRLPFPETLSCSFVSVSRPGGLASPVPPTASGIGIPNAHWLDDGLLLRAMAPHSEEDYQELADAGIEAVLIFKLPTGTGSDVANEITTLLDSGLDEEAVLNVPFAWRDYPDFATPCQQTLQSLRFLQEQREAERPTLMHCTVGEDRTGYLAGLYRLLNGEEDVQGIFEDEMCERGFGTGNPFKPTSVTSKIDVGLVPLYRKMAFKVRQGELTWDLEEAACAFDPVGDPRFEEDAALDPTAFACGTFTRFTP